VLFRPAQQRGLRVKEVELDLVDCRYNLDGGVGSEVSDAAFVETGRAPRLARMGVRLNQIVTYLDTPMLRALPFSTRRSMACHVGNGFSVRSLITLRSFVIATGQCIKYKSYVIRHQYYAFSRNETTRRTT